MAVNVSVIPATIPPVIPRPLFPLCVLFLAAPVLAQTTTSSPTMDVAQQHYRAGLEFYKSGDYESARVEFEAGHRLSKLPTFLLNLCFVANKQNRWQEAINYCEQYLRTKDGTADENADAQKYIAHAKAQLGIVTAVPTPTTAATASQRSSVPAGAVALLIGGGVLIIGGIGAGLGARATSQTIEAGPQFDDLGSLQTQGTALQAVMITGLIGGGVALAAGAGWMSYWARKR